MRFAWSQAKLYGQALPMLHSVMRRSSQLIPFARYRFPFFRTTVHGRFDFQ